MKDPRETCAFRFIIFPLTPAVGACSCRPCLDRPWSRPSPTRPPPGRKASSTFCRWLPESPGAPAGRPCPVAAPSCGRGCGVGLQQLEREDVRTFVTGNRGGKASVKMPPALTARPACGTRTHRPQAEVHRPHRRPRRTPQPPTPAAAPPTPFATRS